MLEGWWITAEPDEVQLNADGCVTLLKHELSLSLTGWVWAKMADAPEKARR